MQEHQKYKTILVFCFLFFGGFFCIFYAKTLPLWQLFGLRNGREEMGAAAG